MENQIWDEGQLGAKEGVLGTANQLIIDRCIMEEVKQCHILLLEEGIQHNQS